MKYSEKFNMLELDSNYLLDSYNHNLKNGNENENKRILDELEKVRADYFSLALNLNTEVKIDSESIFLFLKSNTFKNLSDDEIAGHVNTLCEAFDEVHLKYVMSLLTGTAFNSYDYLRSEINKMNLYKSL